jgi:hypothetical protein
MIYLCVMENIQKFQNRILRTLSSDKLLYLILIFFVLQSAWIAFSFRFPMLYDELFHVSAIEVFSQQFSFFIDSQPEKYDHVGNLATGSSGIYHYLMSYLFRFLNIFTDSQAVKVVALRLVNILMFTVGLSVFAKVFTSAGTRKSHTNLGLLIFILLPIVPFTAATVNYDNMLFLLTAIYMHLSLKIIQTNKVDVLDYVKLATLGLFALMVKIAFLPIFGASFIYIAIIATKRHGKSFFPKLLSSTRSLPRGRTSLVILSFIAMISLFSSVFIVNIVSYGSLTPECSQVLGAERCSSNFISQRRTAALNSKHEKSALTVTDYSQEWFKDMIIATNISSNKTTEGVVVMKYPLPVIHLLVFIGVLASALVISYSWVMLRLNSAWHYLSIMSLVLLVTVYLNNVRIYYDLLIPAAIQPRYFLNLLPIVTVLVVVAANKAFGSQRWAKIALLTFVMLLFTQGGGVTSHILLSDNTWYWQNDYVFTANDYAKKAISPLVRETPGKYGF